MIEAAAFDHRRDEAVLGLPAVVEAVVLIPLGWPYHIPGPPRRRETAEFVHNNSC